MQQNSRPREQRCKGLEIGQSQGDPKLTIGQVKGFLIQPTFVERWAARPQAALGRRWAPTVLEGLRGSWGRSGGLRG